MDYADLFATESREHLSAVNHWLLQLERAVPSGGSGGRADVGEAVGALFRAVHTVKGMSATMGYDAVTELSHALETLLDRVRRGALPVTPELMDALFQAADALERSIELAAAGRAGDADVSGAIATLHAGTDGIAGEGRMAVPGAAMPGGDDRAWTAEAPAGEGRLVRVRLERDAPLPGVRAYLVVEKAKTLGTLTAVSPSVERLQADDFAGDFALRLLTEAPDAEVERVLRAAGFVDQVATDAGPPAGPSGAPALPGEPVEPAAHRKQRHARIDVRRLDTLMNLIGELVVTRGRLTQLASAAGDPALEEAVADASRLISQLREEIMTSRMVPVGQVFDRFPRFVRDAARSLGKDVEFSVEGQDVELDRSMLDEIGEPVVHLLRNAVDHGIELPAARLAAGKPAGGRVTLSAARDRSAVLIRVSDDGRGVDRARVLARARELGLVDAARAGLTDEELFRLVSRAGFSTATTVTEMSGRGVGVDAVHHRVRALGGALEMASTAGEGTTVSLRLPLTLAIVTALLARVGGECYAIPLTHVDETVELDPANVRRVCGREVLVVREDVVPLFRLRDLVRLPGEPHAGGHVVIVEVGARMAGLVVDQLRSQQEIVIKPFDGARDGLALFSGTTILSDGAPALVLDVSTLL